MANVNDWSPLEDGNINLDQYSLERQISPESELNRYAKKIMAAVRAKADAMQAEIDTLAPMGGVVHIEGDETVGGVKTFEEPIVGDVSVTVPVPEGVTPVQRTLAERFSDIVNVKDFGAAGDGATDDTAAFQSAAAAAGGRAVFVPQGSYRLSSSATGSFYSDGPISFADASVDVRCIAYAGQTARKAVKFKAPFQFSEYSTALAAVQALDAAQEHPANVTSLYPQACCHTVENGKECLYIYYQAMPASTAANVLVKYNITSGQYIGYWVLPNSCSGEGLAVVEKSGTKYVYAPASTTVDGVTTYRISRYVFAGDSGSSLIVDEDDFASIPFAIPFFSRNDSGSWIVQGYHSEQPAARPPMLSIYNDNAELVSQFYWDTYDFDTLSNYSDYDSDQMAIPHKQGVFYDAGQVYLFAGGSSNLSETYNVSDIGVIQKNLYGDTVRTSVCKSKGLQSAVPSFAKKLTDMLGETVQWTESEGGYVCNGKVYSLVLAKTSAGEHLLIIEEFSEDAASIDFSDCIASSSNIPWLVDRRFYPRYGTGTATFKNPFTNADLVALDDFIVMMAKYGISDIVVNLLGTAIEPKIGTAYIAKSQTNQPVVVEIKKQSNSTFFVSVLTRENGISSATAHDNFSSSYVVYVDTSTWAVTSCSPLNVSVGSCLDLRGSAVEMAAQIDGHAAQTGLLRFAVESNSGVFRLGRSAHSGAAGVNSIVMTLVNSTPGTAGDFSASRSVFFRYGDVLPTPSNTISLGSGSMSWKEIYVGNPAVNLSDARFKENIVSPDESLMRAWDKVRFAVFQFKDAVEAKGADDARLHVGVVAQQVVEAFASEGLDASRYGLLCHDAWDDLYETETVVDVAAHVNEATGETVPAQTHEERRLLAPAGDRYGIRYGEALALECAYQRWLGEKRDARIAALEAIVNGGK